MTDIREHDPSVAPAWRRSRAAIASALAAILLAMASPATTAAAAGDEEVASCLQFATRELPSVAQQALARIDGLPRRLLAARSYLRFDDLAQRWSWSEQQVRDYEVSPERQRALREIERVQLKFAQLNPGYRLLVNVQVRSLDLQLQRWNENPSVLAAANRLRREAAPACAASGPQGFAAWLTTWAPSPPPNLAAPGLSPHGQGRAYDFQIYQGDRLVAGTEARRIREDWVVPGWAAKLATAVAEASPAFSGPLLAPNEPWHYAYEPL